MEVESVSACYGSSEEASSCTVAVADIVQNLVKLEGLLLVQPANVRTGECHSEGHGVRHAS